MEVSRPGWGEPGPGLDELPALDCLGTNCGALTTELRLGAPEDPKGGVCVGEGRGGEETGSEGEFPEILSLLSNRVGKPELGEG